MSKSDSRISQLTEANNAFGFRLLGLLAQRAREKNVFISPHSIAQALAMTYNGAQGTTQRAMAQTLGLTKLSLRDANAAYADMTRGARDSQVELASANAIWAQQGLKLSSDFSERIKKSFAGKVANLDFADSQRAADVINRWVAGKTRDKIKQLVSANDLVAAILVLVNAIYFKGTWARQFDQAQTRDGMFTLLDAKRKRCAMMSQSGDYNYFENDLFQAVTLPYTGEQVNLCIFLPKPNVSVARLCENLTIENWQAWTTQFVEMGGDIVLPRFKIEYGVELNDALIALGMEIAFGPKADFSGMGVGEATISKVIHKTFVEVNEAGTEAAAATGVIMLRAAMIQERFRMVVDRPFFCAIQDNATGSILFMGLIVEP